MSSDTGRENASVVDSSVTEWKNDMGNSEDPENEDVYPFRAQEAEQSHTADKRGELYNARYFIIKSLNHQNIQLSIDKGIWATQVMNEPILEEAFHELPQDVGEALCELLDKRNDVDVSLKRNRFTRDDLPSKRPCIEPPYSLADEDYNVPPLHLSWAGTPMPYNPFIYQHQADPSRFHLTHPHTSATEYFPNTMGVSKVSSMKNFRIDRNLTNLQVNDDMSTQFDVGGLSAKSPLASTLTEDDFLGMTYEEYLEAHGRTCKELCHPLMTVTPSPTIQESTSRKHDDDSNSSLVTGRHHSRKRTHNSP